MAPISNSNNLYSDAPNDVDLLHKHGTWHDMWIGLDSGRRESSSQLLLLTRLKHPVTVITTVTHDCDRDTASSVSSNVLLTHLPSSTNSVEEWSSEPMPDVGAQPPAMDGQQLGDPLAGDQQAGGVDQQQQWST